eukprot:TRINITY_DN1110_c0_g1_i1.p1 TRINITY_DN1110_c0_g1~~TRINITY_DN1110_c0_g1_i1.p1  ORF type:complete len:571 (+),score=79.44 TRINITY_DN1110_c0_g1_i1:57-1769(+)
MCGSKAMAFISSIQLLSVHFLFRVGAVGNDGFLSGHRQHIESSMSEFRDAMSSVMGCGGEVDQTHLESLRKRLLPMWRVLPKNQGGLVEWRMVRYLAHRYFMQKSSLLVRGFEPLHQINSSFTGAAQILEAHMPSIAATTVTGAPQVYSLDEVVAMIATLNQLIKEDEATRLEGVYAHRRTSTARAVDAAELGIILEEYMVNFVLGSDQASIDTLIKYPKLRPKAIPNWADIQAFAAGLVQETEFLRHRFPRQGHALVAFSGLYSFADAQEVVSRITDTFASFWEDECQTIKRSLVAMDRSGTGRLSLVDFYGANANGEWRFGESEAYLRDLGALDESSVFRGKQVVIPNYLQGVSNCIVSTPHYLVCCVNECEGILNDVEDAVGGPVARPEEILPIIGNVTGIDEESAKLDVALRDQLQQIAKIHGGQVPLHGRLFAQWLHFAFPRECQFPLRTGAHTSQSPSQYGENSLVSQDVVDSHKAMQNASSSLERNSDDVQWISQWSEEEELLSDYKLQMESPWDRSSRGKFVSGAVLMGIVWSVIAVMIRSASSPSKQRSSCDVTSHRACFV